MPLDTPIKGRNRRYGRDGRNSPYRWNGWYGRNWRDGCNSIRYSKEDSRYELYEMAEEEVRKHLETIEDEQLRKDIEEFQKADKAFNERQNNTTTSNSKPITKSHPQAYYTSRLLGFTKQLNDILEKEIYGHKEDITCETGVSQSLGKYYHIFFKKKKI